jgi:hypothetical protein
MIFGFDIFCEYWSQRRDSSNSDKQIVLGLLPKCQDAHCKKGCQADARTCQSDSPNPRARIPPCCRTREGKTALKHLLDPWTDVCDSPNLFAASRAGGKMGIEGFQVFRIEIPGKVGFSFGFAPLAVVCHHFLFVSSAPFRRFLA